MNTAKSSSPSLENEIIYELSRDGHFDIVNQRRIFNTWNMLTEPKLVSKILELIHKDYESFLQNFDFFCGIANSGVPIATLLHYCYQKKLVVTNNENNNGRTLKGNIDIPVNSNILIIDSVVNKGSTLSDFELWFVKKYRFKPQYFSLIYDDTRSVSEYFKVFRRIFKEGRFHHLISYSSIF